MTFASRYLRELSVAAAYALLLMILLVLTPSFYRSQFAAVWVSAAPVLVAAVGMTLVILARHIDISIGSQVSVCGVVAGVLAKQGLPLPLVVFAVLALGLVFGAVNGWLVAFARLPSIVVTLATMVILREALRWTQQGEHVRGLPPNFQWLGIPQAAGQSLIVLLALAIFAALAWAMRFVAAGRCVYAVGSDREAARLAGIRPDHVEFWVFCAMGAFAALSAVLVAIQFPQVDPNAGVGLELQVIAAVVVGGVAISGGRGTLAGTLIGVALLGTIGSALVFLNVHPAWQRAIQGGIILLAVATDGLRRRA
jgi:rhamnose transport system permease protein